MMVPQDTASIVLTVGHSTRPLDEFVALLLGHSVTRLIDVRSVPRSRRNPHFNRDSLAAALDSSGVQYEHVAGLGGFRRPSPNSTNAGWRNAAFRGYADYMQTAEFSQNLASLIQKAQREQLALMCAEAVPWRCHRSLIADALVAHGLRVEEIISETRRKVHTLTPFAKVNDMAVCYPPIDATAPGRAQNPQQREGSNHEGR